MGYPVGSRPPAPTPTAPTTIGGSGPHRSTRPLTSAIPVGVVRFSGLDYTTTAEGAIRIEGFSAWFDCTLDQEIDAGDHLLALLRVQNLELGGDDIGPLVFHSSRFGRLAAA